MGLYYSATRGEIRELDDALHAAWVAAGNPKATEWISIPDQPGAGYTWDGSQWVAPPPPGPAPVPQSVTKRQLYRGLMQVGWLGTTMPQIDAAISALIATMPEPPREVARVEFFTSRDYLRNNALLLGALMSPPLSKTVAEIDDFFRLCGSFAPE
jgi:hypothetical protein